MKRSILWMFAVGFSVLCSTGLAHAQDRDGAEFERSVVSLHATKAAPDPEAPWSTQNADVSGFAGVYIGDNRILAPATLVARAVYIQAQKIEDVTKIPMKIEFVDYEANLAVISPVEGRITGMTAMSLGDDAPLNSDVWMVGIENERQIQRASLKIMEIALKEVITGGMSLSAYLLTGQTRTVCRGEPLIRKGKLVGICLGVTDNQPWALTSQAIRHFLKDQLDAKSYKGFPVLGLALSVVKSPHFKHEVKWPEHISGVRVSEVQENSAFADDIKVNDVVVAVDGHVLDNRGFFKHPLWGSIPIRHHLITHFAGDKVTLRVYREGFLHEFTKPMRRFSGQDLRIPGMTFEGPLLHLIVGGLVFRELGVDFLASFGRDWQRSAPSHLLYLFNYENKPDHDRNRVLIMTHVLPDTFNQGYDREGLLILEKVNGVVAHNLQEFRQAILSKSIERNGEKFVVFDFDNGSQIVLPLKGMDAAHKRIAKSYNVGTPESFLSM